MNTDRTSSLLIDDGGACALITAMFQEQDTINHVWFSWTNGESLRHRQTASRQHASLLDATWSQSDCPWPGTNAQGIEHDSIHTTRQLLAAGQAALSHGCSSVIWPIACGDDVESMSRAVDRVRLIEHTWHLDVPGDRPALLLDLPIVDLTSPQLADLAIDLAVPLEMCWDCLWDVPTPCGSCPGCQRVMSINADRGIVINPPATREPA